MEAKRKFEILWESELLLDSIRWNKKKFQEFQPPIEYKNEIKSNWEKHVKEHPKDYDGDLLFLDNYHFKDNYLFLDTSFMKFSTAIYMVKNQIPVNNGIGVLGTQYLIFSSKNQYILVGTRSLSQSYFPGALSGPGGILEYKDLNKTPKEALMREAYEEIQIPLKLKAFLTAILAGWNGVSVAFIISTSISDSYNFNPKEVIPTKDEEWEGNLRWLSIEELKNRKTDQFLEALIYYRSKLFITS